MKCVAVSVRGGAAVLAATVLSAALGACGKSPTAPAPGPLVLRLEVSGPSQIDPGDSAQFQAVAHFADGTVRDVTTEAAWSSNEPSVLAARSDGNISGVASGEAKVTATWEARVGFADAMVIPAGTFRLTVDVFDAGPPALVLSAAEVIVVTSDGTILPSRGRRFYGASGRTEVRTTYDPRFYEPDVRVVDVTEGQHLEVQLTPRGQPVVDARGTYTMTISAAASCASSLPDEVMTRTYTATVTQFGKGLLRVTLHDGVFESYQGVSGNSLDGEILDVGQGRLSLAGREGVGWGATSLLMERLDAPAGTYEPTGGSIVRIDETGIAGSLNGSIVFRPNQGGTSFRCSAENHAIKMIRR